MTKPFGFLVATLLVVFAVPSVAQVPSVTQEVVSTIAFASTRDNPDGMPMINTNEIYLIDYLTDGTFSTARRLTENADGDFFAALSPDGKGKIVFDSNRRRAPGEPDNISDLFLMNRKGHGQTFLTRGGSPTWAPPGPHSHVSKMIAFQASASGTGLPTSELPGASTADSDIFVVNIDDLLEHGAPPQNITNNPNAIDDDPDWSPDGLQIVFTSHDINEDPRNNLAEIYVVNADGSGAPEQLTFNEEEERAPDWSPDGTRILFMCRRGGTDFEICVMNADGTGQTQLTFNTVGDLTPSWSPDGQLIVFQRALGPPLRNQLFVMYADGTGEQQLTTPPGLNRFANWGVIEIGQGQGKQ